MISFNCIVQEGIVPEELRSTLAEGLVCISSSVFGESPDDIHVGFTEIPHGYAFRGGELSTTSMVRADVPPGCQEDVRVDFMQQISDMWCSAAGCSVHDLVVSARDCE